jgi:hypothetical protein
MTGHSDRRVHALEIAPLALGILAMVAAPVLSWDAAVLDLIVSPPLIVRLALAGAAIIAAFVLLGAAVGRLEGRVGGVERGDLASMIRGVRLAFLAVAAGAVAVGWLLGHALPFVIALIIAGIDVVETSFLLLVVRRSREPVLDR